MPKAVRTPLLLLSAVLLATCAAPHPRPPRGSDEVVEPPCDPPLPPQSPRRLERFTGNSRTSIIRNGPNESSIYYTPRGGGEEQKLLLCSHHYHCDIEHKQECNTYVPPGRKDCEPLVKDDWVEIHMVYAKALRPDMECPSENLDCCAEPPFVARGYQAQVKAEGNPTDPLPAPSAPFAEYTGSNTGWDTPGDCKPFEVQWSFSLGCDKRVSLEQLDENFDHADAARVLQGGVRVSPELWLVRP
jgi:hypothetical protein